MSVGLEIAINKVAEGDDYADYGFSVPEGKGGLAVRHPSGRAGIVRISKTTGSVELQRKCPDDIDGLLFSRVVVALRRHHCVGEYPDTTSWAG